MFRHALILLVASLVAACATLPVDGPAAPPNDPAAGKLTLPSGRSVWIYPRDLAFTGAAKYRWPSGRTYDGDWEKGEPHGNGIMEFTSGERFSGTWERGKRHGQGELTLANGDHYEGQFADGVRHGTGVERSSEGLYRGTWSADLPAGQGEFLGNDGSNYRGEWGDGQRQGFGAYTDANGNSYQGDWFADAPHGFGSMAGIDGERYEGRWVEGQRDGYGSASDASELAYTGTWLEGLRHGFGIVSRPDGSRYEGEWRNDKRHGQGRETSSDGSFHDGAWERNQPLGPGTRRNRTGIEISGVWTGDQVSTGLLTLPTGHEYAGPLFKNHNKQASPQLLNWLILAGDQGDPYAQFFLGTLFSDFEDPAKNIDLARLWFGKAAATGIAQAQYRLALIHQANNTPRAIELLAGAADQDHAGANRLLGEYYLAGDAVPRNIDTAIRYFQRAMSAGSVQARNNLAWVLSTATASEFRDGERALALIRPIALLYGDWQYLDTLAAAYAESGDFANALTTQETAIAKATDGDDGNIIAVQQMQQRLRAFRQQQPARE